MAATVIVPEAVAEARPSVAVLVAAGVEDEVSEESGVLAAGHIADHLGSLRPGPDRITATSTLRTPGPAPGPAVGRD